MRIIKLALISFIIFFLLITAISLFIPSHVRISRASGITASREELYTQVADPANWKNWFPGTDSAQSYFEGNMQKGIYLDKNAGRALVITTAKPDEVTAQYKGVKQKKVMTGWNFVTASEGHTTVQWYMDFSLRWYPWEKFSSILFEKQYGPQMEQGLANLKRLAENN